MSGTAASGGGSNACAAGSLLAINVTNASSSALQTSVTALVANVDDDTSLVLKPFR